MEEKHIRFCEEYLVDLCGAAAARRAGYAESAAKQTASRILKRPEVQAYLRDAMERRAGSVRLCQEDVLRALGEIAFSQASDASGAEVKIAGKLRALELLGKHLGMFEGRGGKLEPVTVVEDMGMPPAETPHGCGHGG